MCIRRKDKLEQVLLWRFIPEDQLRGDRKNGLSPTSHVPQLKRLTGRKCQQTPEPHPHTAWQLSYGWWDLLTGSEWMDESSSCFASYSGICIPAWSPSRGILERLPPCLGCALSQQKAQGLARDSGKCVLPTWAKRGSSWPQRPSPEEEPGSHHLHQGTEGVVAQQPVLGQF